MNSPLQGLECRIPPLLQVLACVVAMRLLSFGLPQYRMVVPTPAAVAPVVAGALIAMLGVIAFRSVRTTIDPRAPESTSALVVDGIYRFTRNPMYLGFLLVLLGSALLSGSLLSLLFLPLFVLYMNRFQIRPEERQLEALFGDKFRDYASRVRRWI